MLQSPRTTATMRTSHRPYHHDLMLSQQMKDNEAGDCTVCHNVHVLIEYRQRKCCEMEWRTWRQKRGSRACLEKARQRSGGVLQKAMRVRNVSRTRTPISVLRLKIFHALCRAYVTRFYAVSPSTPCAVFFRASALLYSSLRAYASAAVAAPSGLSAQRARHGEIPARASPSTQWSVEIPTGAHAPKIV